MDTTTRRVSISEFKATCLRLLAEVERTGEPILVTKRGKPLATVGPPPLPDPASWIGSGRGRIEILDDLSEPVLTVEEWEQGSLDDWEEALAESEARLRGEDGGP